MIPLTKIYPTIGKIPTGIRTGDVLKKVKNGSLGYYMVVLICDYAYSVHTQTWGLLTLMCPCEKISVGDVCNLLAVDEKCRMPEKLDYLSYEGATKLLGDLDCWDYVGKMGSDINLVLPESESASE